MLFNFTPVQNNTSNVKNPFMDDNRFKNIVPPPPAEVVTSPIAANAKANSPLGDNFKAENNLFKGFKPQNDARFVA